jgi:hypothetical protein
MLLLLTLDIVSNWQDMYPNVDHLQRDWNCQALLKFSDSEILDEEGGA